MWRRFTRVMTPLLLICPLEAPPDATMDDGERPLTLADFTREVTAVFDDAIERNCPRRRSLTVADGDEGLIYASGQVQHPVRTTGERLVKTWVALMVAHSGNITRPDAGCYLDYEDSEDRTGHELATRHPTAAGH